MKRILRFAWALPLGLALFTPACVSTGHGGAGLFVGSTTNRWGDYSIGAYYKNNTATNVWRLAIPINPAAALQALVSSGSGGL